jgi:predicted nucleic-acid-binding protein
VAPGKAGVIILDTNVWVRYVTNDDAAQAAQAVRLITTATAIFVPKTVLLELEWVLRAVYGLSSEAVERALLHILGLPMVQPEQPEAVAAALAHARGGLDFADALHLVSIDGVFHTFDKQCIQKAKARGLKVAHV